MKTPALTALLGLSVLLSPASGTILLNEIHINPPPTLDLNYEFIELRSSTDGIESCAGLTLLIIENNGAQVGEVEEALDLSSFSTGSNGLLLIGNGYDESPLGGPWTGFKAPSTSVADPSGTPPFSSLGDDNIDPNGGLTVLLVSGWTGMSNATATSLGDVDVDNNSVLDWLQTPKPAGAQATQPFAVQVDSVGFRDLANSPVRRPYTTADLNVRPGSAATFSPDNISRRLSRSVTPGDQNNASAWYGGNLLGTEANAIAYDIQFFGDFKGQATPGQTNLNAAATVGNFVINEVAINPPGQDDGNFEYIEIRNASEGSSAASLQGLALLVIRSNDNAGVAALGTVKEAWDLSTLTTGANGLLLLGNNYNAGDIPWGSYIDPLTQLGDPGAPGTQNPVRWSSMGDDDIGSSDGFTLLLVQNFTGTIEQDLDTNNDGVLDLTPWTTIKDSVGFNQLAPGTGKTYATAKITSTPAYDIDNLSRKLSVTTAQSASAWYGGDYGGNSPFTIAFQDEPARPAIGGFRGAATPGRTNWNDSAVAAPIRLNEVNINPVANPDGSYEYVELVNANLTLGGMNGLTLVIADGSTGAQNGTILESIDLSGLSTGPNGLAILGDSYDNFSPYDAPQKLISPLTAREDPAGLDAAGDIGPNSALVIMLTKGAKPAIGSNIAALAAGDVVDSIGFGSSPNATAALLSTSFTPDNVSRYPGEFTANTAASWFSGELDASQGDGSLDFGANFAGAYKGGASPGRYNHGATPPSSTAALLINEVHINPPGGDDSVEFVEFRATPGAAVSTNGYTLLLLDGSGSSTGGVLEAWSLDGLSTGTNGLLMTGAGYPASLPWTGATAPAAATRFGSPAGMAPGDIAGYSSNGAASFLLVRNFSGKVGLDLDGGIPPTTTGADDGTLDITPWSIPISDAVGLRLWDTTLVPPSLAGRVYGGVDLSQTGYTPDNLSRHGNNTTALATVAWYGGDVAGTSSTATAFDPVQKFPGAGFVGMVTAGRPNVGPALDDSADDDHDTAINLIEAALNMNPAVADPQKLPQVGTFAIGTVTYPTLSYTRFLNGSTTGSAYSANGFRYEVQSSLDLITWTGLTEAVSATPDGNGLTETAVARPETSYFANALATKGTVFLRLKITRL